MVYLLVIALFDIRPSRIPVLRGLVVALTAVLMLEALPASASTTVATTSTARAKHGTHATAATQSSAKRKARTAAKSRMAKSRRAAVLSPAQATGRALAVSANDLALKSSAALVVDEDTGETLALKNADTVMPIASLTKLMTALVVVDAKLPMDEELQITSEDVDTERNTHSRLAVGTRLRRDELLLLALMASENRAAMALSRNYPGGRDAFIAQMNAKALSLGMRSTHFADPAGLSNGSMSTARDLHRMVSAAYGQPLIRSYTTQPETTVIANGRVLTFANTNRLVRYADDWDIGLQKTGFTNEAGRCLVMQVNLLNRRLAMIFLDSNGTLTRYADAARVRRRLELEAAKAPVSTPHLPTATTAAATASAS